MKKIGRNELCHCNSKIKYKKCCFNKVELTYDISQNISTDNINELKNLLLLKFKKYTIIDISNNLNTDNYIDYLKKNYYKTIIMLAEKNNTNNNLFIDKTKNPSEDILIMYKGGYRIIESCRISNYILNIEEFIQLQNNINEK